MVVDMVTGRKAVHFTDDVQPSGYDPDALSLPGDLVAGHFFRVDKVEKFNGRTNTTVHSEGMRVWETATGQTITQVNGKQWHRMVFHPKKPLLAVSEFPAIEIRDLVSGNTVWRQKMSAGPFASFDGADCTSMAFTPDGRHLATGHPDGTILLWPVNLPSPKPVRLAPNEIDALWSTLKDADAAKAWQAVWRLADAPEDAVPLLRKMLKPVHGAPKNITNPLLADLGGDNFAKHETATKRLKDLGLLAESALRQNLAANPPLELRQRVEALLKTIVENPPALTPEDLQTLRAVAVLSRIQSPPARQILEDLANGVESAPLTLAAKAALGS